MLVNMKQLEDIFNTKEFKSLSWGQRLWVRIKVAFFGLIDIKNFILLLTLISFTSCGVYQVSTTPKVKISKVLTITSTGDTLAVPIKQFQNYNYNNIFDNYNFNFGWNSWNYWGYPYYGWNNLYRPNSWYYRDFYYNPPIYNYNFRVNPVPQRPRVYINGRRGSSNNNNVITPRDNNRIYLRNPNNNQNNLRNQNPSQSRVISPPLNPQPRPSNTRPQSKPRVPNSNTNSGRGNSNKRN